MLCRLENIAFHFIWQKQQLGRVISHQNSSSSTLPHLNLHFTLDSEVSYILPLQSKSCPLFCFPFTHKHCAWILTPQAGLFDWQAVQPWPPVMGLYAPVQLQDPARPEPPIPWLAAFVLTHWITQLHGGKGFCCSTAFTWTHGIKPSRNSTSFEWVCQTGGTPLQTADKCGMMGSPIVHCPWNTMKN